MFCIVGTKVGYKLTNPFLGNCLVVHELYSFTKHNVAVVSKYGKYGLVNSDADLVIPLEYDEILVLDEIIVICKRKKQYFLKDIYGKPVINFAFCSEQEAYACGLYMSFEI